MEETIVQQYLKKDLSRLAIATAINLVILALLYFRVLPLGSILPQ